MYETILFDFDGTLVPSLEIWLGSFQYALEKFGRRVPETKILTRFFYREYDDVAQEFDLPSGTELRTHVHAGLRLGFETVEMVAGARETLAWCRERGLAMGLVTSSPRPEVEVALGQLGIRDYFGAIVTGSEITHFKPHPEPVLRALELLERPAKGALMVGDYLADVLAGQAAGVDTALFLPPSHGKFYDFDELRALAPTFEFEEWPALHDYLQTRTASLLAHG